MKPHPGGSKIVDWLPEGPNCNSEACIRSVKDWSTFQAAARLFPRDHICLTTSAAKFVCKLQYPTEPPSALLIASTRSSIKELRRRTVSLPNPPHFTPLQSNCLAHSFSSFFLLYLLLIPESTLLSAFVYPFPSIPPAFASGLLVFLTRVRWHRTDASQASYEPAGGLIT